MTRIPRHPLQPVSAQVDLFGGLILQTQLIARRKDFESLFDGFSKMRAISYVVSPDLLLAFFDNRGYTEVEVVVGESLADKHKQSDIYKQGLEQKGIEAIERLAAFVEKGTLRIYLPDRTIHTKLYILEKSDIVRVIQTSANLTETAQEARKQINYAWYVDLPPDHLLLQRLLQDYESHLNDCEPFMEDLKNLLKQDSGTDKKQTIEAWLKGVISEEQDTETREVFHQIAVNLAETIDVKKEPVTILRLPESGEAKRRIERLLAPLKPVDASRNQMQISKPAFIQYVYETHHIPLLILSQERQLLLGLDGFLTTLSEAPSDPTLVSKALAHIEAYLNTVESGVSSDPLFAKTSMFEALLYVFFAPFAHQSMKARRKRFGLMDLRGPRYLYIYGPSQNGKSTFLRFALKLLTGRIIEPLSGKDFTETRIRNAALLETAFPLAFDDLPISATRGVEPVFKSYWERWWREEHTSPQILITSNTSRLKEWGKSRVKRVDFDVHFVPNEAAKEKLAQLFAEDNHIFRWFSCTYLNHLDSPELSSDDELKLARSVMNELYEYAKRPLPEFFPVEPIERLYDSGRRDWHDLLHILRKAEVKKEAKRTRITLAKDIQPWEVNDYLGYLPQTIKYKRTGSTIIVENPKDFEKWLEQPRQARSLLASLQGYLRKKLSPKEAGRGVGQK
ncbi:MAG: phospholipase D family protein [Chloroflexi bacterium]|nr:phospholipase D family protein [Chloroflexota bacterium]